MLREILAQCGKIHNRQIDAELAEIYQSALDGVDIAPIQEAILREARFPTPARILELAAGEPSEWWEILAVAQCSKIEARISGIAVAALIKVTGAAGSRDALRKLCTASEYATDRIRKDWEKEISRPVEWGAIAPADEILTLQPEPSPVRVEYPIDWDCSVRADSFIRLLQEGRLSGKVAELMSARFPLPQRQRVKEAISALGAARSATRATLPTTALPTGKPTRTIHPAPRSC
jgi:hypothetical protein